MVVLALLAMGITAAIVLPDRSDRKGDATMPIPNPGTVFRVPRLGVVGVRPPRWRLGRPRRAVRLSGPDRSAVVGVSATASPVAVRTLMTSTLTAVNHSYRRAKLSAQKAVRIGGLPGRATSGSATNAAGVRLYLLVAAAKGRRRSYLLQVFVARKAPAARLAEAQDVVNSLELSG